jgi:hypothetical protein
LFWRRLHHQTTCVTHRVVLCTALQSEVSAMRDLDAGIMQESEEDHTRARKSSPRTEKKVAAWRTEGTMSTSEGGQIPSARIKWRSQIDDAEMPGEGITR